MAFPSTILGNTNPAGTSLLTSPDHAAQHSTVNSDLTAVEQKLGLGAGTPTTTNKLLVATGNGTAVWGGTVNALTLGTPVIGTPAITGGTSTNTVINSGTLGTPSVTGGTLTAPLIVTRTIGSAAYSGTVSGTTTLNLANATRHLVNMPNSAGAVTLALSNVSANQPFIVEILQGTAGLGTITWFSTIRWAGSAAPSQTLTASRKDTFGFMPTGTATFDGYIVGQNV